MSPNQAKELLPIIEAFANGEIIEYNSIYGWIPKHDLSFADSPKNYRIKPKPVEGWVIINNKGVIISQLYSTKDTANHELNINRQRNHDQRERHQGAKITHLVEMVETETNQTK